MSGGKECPDFRGSNACSLFLVFFQLEEDIGIRQMEILKVRFVANEVMGGHGARAPNTSLLLCFLEAIASF